MFCRNANTLWTPIWLQAVKKPKLVQAHALAPDFETRAPGADTTKVLCICNFVLPFSKITHFSPKNFKFHSICKLAHWNTAIIMDPYCFMVYVCSRPIWFDKMRIRQIFGSAIWLIELKFYEAIYGKLSWPLTGSMGSLGLAGFPPMSIEAVCNKND